MSTAILDRPLPAPTSAGDDDLYHLWCCDENTAMCGADLTGIPEGDRDEDEPLCPMCDLAEIEGFPCPVPGCPGDGGLLEDEGP